MNKKIKKINSKVERINLIINQIINDKYGKD